MNIPEDGALRWWVGVGQTAVRGVQVFLTRNDEDKFLMHDEEIEETVTEWDGFVEVV